MIELASVTDSDVSSENRIQLVSGRDASRAHSDADPALAARLYSLGYSAYWRGDYAGALSNLEAAHKASDRDARVWYYKGFAEIALKQDDHAVQSFARAVRLQLDHPEQSGQIYGALERIQGSLRIQIQTALKEAAMLPVTPSVSSPKFAQN